MKQVFLMVTGLFLFNSSFAQSERYTKAMTEKVTAVDTVRTADGWREVANAFERIAEAEKTQWLPYYYAALGQVNVGYFSMSSNPAAGNLAATVDPLADKADELLAKAKTLRSKDDAEIYILEKMIATLRMSADPMSRYMKFGPMAAEALAKAKTLDAENPRVYLLEGQDKLYTPEQFGGSKTEAKKLFEGAIARYETHKPETALSPRWGKGTAVYMLGMASK